jgi:hypothetical protein
MLLLPTERDGQGYFFYGVSVPFSLFMIYGLGLGFIGLLVIFVAFSLIYEF